MQDKIYFPGLNGLRFFAALSVVFYHLGITELFGVSREHFFLSHLVLDGGDAVTLFFVLSGFLITYLLLTELKTTETVRVRKFYLRRILRIWPLYYLMVFLGFVVFPMLERATGHILPTSINLMPDGEVLFQLITHLTLLPHVSTFLQHRVDGIQQLWSIGIEESFYLIWPVLVLLFRKRILTLLLGFISLKLAIHLAASLLSRIAGTPDWLLSGLELINYMRVEDMAIGGLGAYILFTHQERLLRVIFHPVVEKGVLLIMVANIFLFTEAHHTYGVRLVINLFLAVVYTLLILNLSSNPHSTFKLENAVFNKLGRISYGIYMYHLFIMYTVSVFFSRSVFLRNDSPWLTVLLYLIIPLLTIGIAHLSYYYFEQPFLRLKKRFTVVKSGEPETTESPVPVSAEPSVLGGKSL
jgi:peptidoglycan/LPS O-acetylase OafA/YrhL